MKGLVHIYHGDGKGKTTCGMGLCCRAAGAGLKVLIYQFMKDGSGNERKVLERVPNVTFASEKRTVHFTSRMSSMEKAAEKDFYRREFVRVSEMIRSGDYDVLFLDEVLYAISLDLMEEAALTGFLDDRPEKLEVILTGRNPSEQIRSRADYISEIYKEKHPFDCGILARDGIEY